MADHDRDRSGDVPRSEEQAAADAADLDAGLRDLAALVSGAQSLDELLHQVATSAARAIPGADGAGVTLLRLDPVGNHVEALAASDPLVATIDKIQYVTLHEGPCITAALERRTVRSGSLGEEKMWPRFGPRVGGLAVHSALSVPLMLPSGELVGVINVYARETNVFDDHAVDIGELFAAPAAVAVHNAHILAQSLSLAAQLQAALSTRPVIEQALGLIRGRTGVSTEQAFTRLRAISQDEHTKLTTVAQRIVDDAVHRARARHTGS